MSRDSHRDVSMRTPTSVHDDNVFNVMSVTSDWRLPYAHYILVDSGAQVSVCPLSWSRSCAVTRGRNLRIRGAGGQDLQHRGEKIVKMYPLTSTEHVYLRYQVCEKVSRPIIALCQLTNGGWRLTTDSDESFLQHRVTGQIIRLESYRGGWYLAIHPTSDDTAKMIRYVVKPDKREVLGVEDEEVIGGETDVKTLPDPVLPSMTERAKHNVTHTPFASWCEHCIKGRGNSSHHARQDPQVKFAVDARRTVSLDYCFLRVTETEAQQTVLCCVDSLTAWIR